MVGTLGGLGISGLGKMFTDLGNSIKDRRDKIESSRILLIIFHLKTVRLMKDS